MKKTMKRNALLSSVAMLIVSAIVLTSATYAWFSAAKEAKITDFSASVQSAEGLVLSVTSGTTGWKNSFTAADVQIAQSSAIIPNKDTPLSPLTTNDCENFFGGGIVNSKITLASTTSGFFKFDIWLKAFKDMNVSLADSTFTSTAGNATKAMKIALIPKTGAEGSMFIIPFDNEVTAWKGLGAIGSYDTNSNDIIDGGTTMTNIVQKDGATISLKTNIAAQYTVCVWLEGNDPDCRTGTGDTIPGSSVSFSLNFKQVGA